MLKIIWMGVAKKLYPSQNIDKMKQIIMSLGNVEEKHLLILIELKNHI